MYLVLIAGIIKWPQVLLIIALLVLFLVFMGVPKAIKEIQQGNKEYKDAREDENDKSKS